MKFGREGLSTFWAQGDHTVIGFMLTRRQATTMVNHRGQRAWFAVGLPFEKFNIRDIDGRRRLGLGFVAVSLGEVCDESN